MPDKQNRFYSSISRYYSEIFPFNSLQLSFVKTELGPIHKQSILDIGCATGELSFALANEGALVTGIDLNEELLDQAIRQNKHRNALYQAGNMLHVSETFKEQSFDSVLCFGNTLVHLQNKEDMQHMIDSVYEVLQPGGKFLLQILNYDYILSSRLSELPLIEGPNIKFIRSYEFPKDSDLIDFKTSLQIKTVNKTLENDTTLYALKSNDLRQLLQSAGFKEIGFFANFKRESFGGNHLPMVVSCTK